MYVGPVRTACSGVTVSPGASLQATVDAHRAGTTFCIKLPAQGILSADVLVEAAS